MAANSFAGGVDALTVVLSGLSVLLRGRGSTIGAEAAILLKPPAPPVALLLVIKKALLTLPVVKVEAKPAVPALPVSLPAGCASGSGLREG